jgi:hypothetical protein
MRTLTEKETSLASGGEAGVPHTDYYYGPSINGPEPGLTPVYTLPWRLDVLFVAILEFFDRQSNQYKVIRVFADEAGDISDEALEEIKRTLFPNTYRTQ